MQGAKLSERLHRYCCCAAAPACAPAITLSLSWTSASSPSGRKNCRYIEYWLTMSGMRRSPPAFDGRVLPNTPPADQGCTSHRPMSAREPLVSRDSCHVWRAAARSSGWHWKSSKKSCSWITTSLPGALACLIEVPTGVASAQVSNILPAGLPFLPAFPCPQTTPGLAGGRRRRHGTEPQERAKTTTASSDCRPRPTVPDPVVSHGNSQSRAKV